MYKTLKFKHTVEHVLNVIRLRLYKIQAPIEYDISMLTDSEIQAYACTKLSNDQGRATTTKP